MPPIVKGPTGSRLERNARQRPAAAGMSNRLAVHSEVAQIEDVSGARRISPARSNRSSRAVMAPEAIKADAASTFGYVPSGSKALTGALRVLPGLPIAEG
jgi:hypothetical protein